MSVSTTESKSVALVEHRGTVLFREIPIAEIVIGDRVREDPTKSIGTLVRSIQAVGLLHPIAVREQVSAGKSIYVLIAGERRVEAFKRLGMQTIPARVETRSTDQK